MQLIEATLIFFQVARSDSSQSASLRHLGQAASPYHCHRAIATPFLPISLDLSLSFN